MRLILLGPPGAGKGLLAPFGGGPRGANFRRPPIQSPRGIQRSQTKGRSTVCRSNYDREYIPCFILQAVHGLFTTLERHSRDSIETETLYLPSMACSLVHAKVRIG